MADHSRASGVGALSVWPLSPWFLTTPPEERGAVLRARVADAIDAALREHRLVIVSAPSGYGKSTALAQWARRHAGAVSWLTLTRFDGDTDRITQGVAAAARRALPARSAEVFDRIPIDLTRPETLVDALAATLSHTGDELVIVVDQAEYAGDLASGALGALAVKRVPGLRLIVVGTTPASEMSTALGEGIETATMGAEDLAFDEEDVRRLSLDVRGTALRAAEITDLIDRTRGWPIAVRLAIGGSPSPLRDLDEYIEDDILSHLPPALAEVTRATVIATPLDAELAVAISGCPEAAMQLEECVQRGLFLDRFSREGHRIYVWHAAFRAAVIASEERRDPAEVTARHARAALHLQETRPLEAVEQFLSAGMPEEAYRLLLESWLEILQTGRVGALDRAFASLPRAYADRAATLRIRASCAWASRDSAGARMLTRRSHDAPADSPAEHAAIAVAGLLTTDDPATLGKHILAVDEALGHPGAIAGRATAHVLFALGYASMRARRGPLETVPTLRSALREAEVQQRPRLAARVAETLSFSLAFSGQFTEALTYADRSMPPEDDDEWLVYDGGGASCTRGFVAYWRDDLETARASFTEVRRLAIGPTAYEPVALMYDALAAACSGDLTWQSDALERLRAMPAETILGVPWHGFRSGALATLALARGRLDDAVHHAEKAVDFPPVPRAIAAEVFRRVGDLARARAIVAATPPAHLTRPAQVMLLVTDALLRDDAAREDAHVVLERAIDLAAQEGIVRPFAGSPPELQSLLERHASWGTRHDAFIAEALSRAPRTSTAGLSAREQEILAYLRTTMTLSEVAAALFLSTNTVKTHVQSLYRKLGVQNRREAVQVRL